LTGLWNGDINVWDYASGAEVRRLRGHTAMPLAGTYFRPDGRSAVSGSGNIFGRADDNTLRVWDVDSGAERLRLEGHTARIRNIALSPDGNVVVSVANDGTLRRWNIAAVPDGDLESGQGAVLLDLTPQVPISVDFSPDGETLALGLAQGSSQDPSFDIILVQAASGQVIRRLNGHQDMVVDVAFSPDGQTLISGSSDTEVIVWNVADGSRTHRLTGHGAAVYCVTFSPDGQWAASASAAGNIIVWDLNQGVALRRFFGHSDAVLGCSFTSKGHTLLSAAADNTVREWRLMPLRMTCSNGWRPIATSRS
jgi:WD40 repeat protein